MDSGERESLPAQEDVDFLITPTQQALASCTGAVVTSLLVTPLDVVKIRLQAQQKNTPRCFLYCNGLMDHFCGCKPQDLQRQWYARPGHFSGTMDAFYKITKTEGITSLWSGLSPTLVLAIPATIIYFVAYEQFRLKLKHKYNAHNAGLAEQPFWIPLISGGTARIFSVTLVSPLELIRTKMQSQKLSYYEIGRALKMLIKQDGVGALWMGVIPTLCRDVPFSAIYWTNYETFKKLFWTSNQPSFSKSFICGGLAGMVAATITTPFDVIKTHQQIQLGEKTIYGGKSKTMVGSFYDTFLDIRRSHGFRGLFAGLFPRVVKVAPSCAIMISSFEYGKIFFNRLAKENQVPNVSSQKKLVNKIVSESSLRSLN
ncbi:solute carrier family 25 member 40-like [Coccinella septempunctata]|uniref:solute carrier family 25 member 40-like n=1 Tax=Coccinella septempunctata TaxID=41139 RepID=UPI001D07F390|nr:solute carrier family 25 member 40-like [Coccinella septempunctata]